MSRASTLTAPEITTGADPRTPFVAAIRRLPPPRCEPPYDDERGLVEHHPGEHSGGAVQGTLALAFLLPSGIPAVPQVPALRLVSGTPDNEVECGTDEHFTATGPLAVDAGTGPSRAGLKRVRRRPGADPFFGPQPTPRALLPAPSPWAGRFVQAVIEVLAGDRSVNQLIRWTDAHVLTRLHEGPNRNQTKWSRRPRSKQPTSSASEPTVRRHGRVAVEGGAILFDKLRLQLSERRAPLCLGRVGDGDFADPILANVERHTHLEAEIRGSAGTGGFRAGAFPGVAGRLTNFLSGFDGPSKLEPRAPGGCGDGFVCGFGSACTPLATGGSDPTSARHDTSVSTAFSVPVLVRVQMNV